MKKYRYIIILTFLSVLVQMYLNFDQLSRAFGGVVFQFIGSGLIGWVFSQFYNKYYKSSRLVWWARFYALMIVGSIVMHLIGVTN